MGTARMFKVAVLMSSFLVSSELPYNSSVSRLQSRNCTTASRKVNRGKQVCPPPYLRLPVFVHSRIPLVENEKFSPTWGTGYETLPNKVRDVLLPVSPTADPTPSASESHDVVMSCPVNKMALQVHKGILGSHGSSALTLGTCRPNKSAKDFLYFEYSLDQCGNQRTMMRNRVVYSNTLRYDPPVLDGPIRRALPFTFSVSCHYNRYQYSYKMGYIPKIKVLDVFKSMTNRAEFILTARNAKWERLSPSDEYVIGKPMYFEAEAPKMAADKRLYLQTCHATLHASHTSTPQFLVVDNFGCMVESKDGRSQFIPYKNNAVRFTVDAFLFSGMSGQHLYMHCSMSIAAHTPSATTKACNYNSTAGRWREVSGVASVCSCCETRCDSASAAAEVVSSKAVTIEHQVPSPTPRRKTAVTTVRSKVKTNTTAAPHMDVDWPFRGVKGSDGDKVLKTSRMDDKVLKTSRKDDKVLKGSGKGETRVKFSDGHEKHMKGEAVVEVSEPRRIFEDIFDFDE